MPTRWRRSDSCGTRRWGPKPGDVSALVAIGVDAFLNDQFAAPISVYPDTLFSQPVEMTQEHFMHLALTGPDQLRQRVAWALHKIWVVSAVDIDNAGAIVTYQRVLMNGAFGNYRDLMRNVTLNPAMGRYLNMLNNRSQAVTGVPPNENYPRELMQLFTAGIPRLNPDGSIIRDANGVGACRSTPKPTSRSWRASSPAGRSATAIPRRSRRESGSENYRVPMEAVARYHDTGAKTFLGRDFAAGQTAQQDLDQALDVLFNHPNVGPFIGRQLILQLVTSNPSPAYVAARRGGVQRQRRRRARRHGRRDARGPHASGGRRCRRRTPASCRSRCCSSCRSCARSTRR